MGIKLLNTLLQRLNTDGIKRVSLEELSGKRIVVDANIYMYRYAAMGNIIENFYLMCSVMRHYDIHPLFIFDGLFKPKEKIETLQNRKQLKEQNKDLLYNLQVELESDKQNEELQKHINSLKFKCASYTKNDLEQVKQLFDSYGIMHRTAQGEADELCAALVLEKKAYACLTEDTDLFVYGCPRIIKYFSCANHTVMFYDLNKILKNLEISFTEFQELCCISGTDYNIKELSNLFNNLESLKVYKKSGSTAGFINWLHEQNEITNEECDKLFNIKKIYNINNKSILKKLDYFVIRNKYLNHYKMKKLLSNNGFVFVS